MIAEFHYNILLQGNELLAIKVKNTDSVYGDKNTRFIILKRINPDKDLSISSLVCVCTRVIETASLSIFHLYISGELYQTNCNFVLEI